MPISLNPETFSAGGLLNDVDVEVVSSRFVTYDYNGKITDPQQMPVALRLDVRVLNSDDEHTEYLSFGRAPDWVIDDEGKTVEPVAGKRPNNNSVFAMFIQSLIEAGFDKARLDPGDISVLEGMKLHVVRRAAPDSWKGLPGQRGGDEKREKTYLAVERILSDAKPAKAAGKPQQQQKAFSKDLLDKLQEAVAMAMPADGKPLKVAMLKINIMKDKSIDQATRKALNEAIQQGALEQIEGVVVDGDTIAM
jgi:hypothetical protein